jgi:multidrug resistance efflux pump
MPTLREVQNEIANLQKYIDFEQELLDNEVSKRQEKIAKMRNELIEARLRLDLIGEWS